MGDRIVAREHLVCSWTRKRYRGLVAVKAGGSLGKKEEDSFRNAVEGKNSCQPWQVMGHSTSKEHS